MSDYGKMAKTLLSYLTISLANLNKGASKNKKTATCVLSECLGVLANKRVSLVLDMNNSMLSQLSSLNLNKTLVWQTRRSIIIELTQRRQHAKSEEDREWAFQQSLLDSKGRRAFSARGRGRRQPN